MIEVESEAGEADDSDSGDDFICLHEKFITESRKKSELRAEVGQWKRGRWTAKEVDILKHNVKSFLLKHKKIKDPAEIIFSERHDKIRSKFYRHIARNIQRPLFAVYRKAIRNFNIENYVPNWSKEQVTQLLREHAKVGNKWADIGRSLGVSGRAARDKHRRIANRDRTGAWLLEEEERLVATIKRLHGDASVDEMVVSPAVTWDQVAEHVRTRNSAQCRSKWLHFRPVEWEGRRWGDCDDLQLLELLSGETAQDEDEVNWMQLSSGWDNARSPYVLRRKWATLRRRVPGSALKSFTERLDYLTDHLVPALTLKIQKDVILNT